MAQKLRLLLIPLGAVLGMLLYLLIAGEEESRIVRENVVRFHVVANSDSKEDQQIKLQLRDGLFSAIEGIFSDCADQESALAAANEHKIFLEQRGEEILRKVGCDEKVTVAIGTRFFPTKDYGALSFPAGSYQAVSVIIGEGKGENFWCVLYPALCISPAVSDQTGAEKMAVSIGEEATKLLERDGQIPKIKFRLVEWYELLKEKFTNS